jgi:hypothetical protein
VSPVGANSSSLRQVMGLGILLLVLFAWLYRESKASASIPTPIGSALPTNSGVPSNQASVTPQPLPVFVVDQTGNPFEPIKDVVIRVSDSTQADNGEDGQLSAQPCKANQSIFAWAPGYEVNSVRCDQTPYRIQLTPLQAIDNPYYIWSSADADCNRCHGNRFNPNDPAGPSYDEMNEWLRSGHAKVYNGGYFESMYRGTSVTGKLSLPARPVIIRNEWVPVPPELSQDYHGPGFKLDFPQQPGNCAYCHVPAAIAGTQESIDLSFPRPGGAWGEGVTCDVCHKVFSVTLADNGFPFIDRPGVLSFRFLRPYSDTFTSGPFSNIFTAGLASPINHHSTCSPIFSQSEFCAACHFGKFGDMVIYNSYGEWRASAYAVNPADAGYRTCQDCHMSHLTADDNKSSLSAQRQACSANNTSFQSFDHNMMDFGQDSPSGKEIPRLVKNAAQIDLDFDTQPTGSNSLDVLVRVTNTQAGHKFPTDSPLRHLILVVHAEDRVSTPLIQVGGPQIPNWAGPGPVTPTSYQDTLKKAGVEDYSGLPGKIFANLLVEEETNLSPAMAYWNETKYAVVNSVNEMTSDTRLPPRGADESTYSFAMPDAGDVKITVQLIYRYAFYDLMVWKEWFDRPDILVATIQCQGPPTRPQVLKQSCRKTGP